MFVLISSRCFFLFSVFALSVPDFVIVSFVLLYHLGMKEALYRTTQGYYGLDISFIKHQGTIIMTLNEKRCLIHHLHISQNVPCLPAKILHKHCCQFLLGWL